MLGVEFIAASRDLIRATMQVRDDLCTTPGVLHWGAIMAFADTVGAYGAFLNLPEGSRTTTLESKASPGLMHSILRFELRKRQRLDVS